MFKLLRAVFSNSEPMRAHAQILGNLCASHVIRTTRALRNARNASADHKANDTIIELYLEENAITDDGAIALADAVKAFSHDVCFLWNMTGIVTRLKAASLPTCSLARREAHLCHDLKHVVWRET